MSYLKTKWICGNPNCLLEYNLSKAGFNSIDPNEGKQFYKPSVKLESYSGNVSNYTNVFNIYNWINQNTIGSLVYFKQNLKLENVSNDNKLKFKFLVPGQTLYYENYLNAGQYLSINLYRKDWSLYLLGEYKIDIELKYAN